MTSTATWAIANGGSDRVGDSAARDGTFLERLRYQHED
jgi:hypothetical protein